MRNGSFVDFIDPPSWVIKEFSNDFIQTFDQLSVKYDNILIRGDLNYNMLLDNSKSTPLNNVCDIFDFSNLIKKSNMFYNRCFTNTYRCDFE